MRVIILNTLLFLGEVYLKLVWMKERYNYEKGFGRNSRGYKNFVHYLWAQFVFAVFFIIETPLDHLKFKQIVTAPILEEFMFRGIMLGLYRDSGNF